MQAFTDQGAKAIVMAPQDTGAIAATLEQLEEKKIPVVSVDTRPDKGKVYMVVRADNRAYGEKACEFLGEQLGGKGRVAELQGDLSSINGRDRSEAFASCMKKNYPGIKVHRAGHRLEGRRRLRASSRACSPSTRDINGIYMQAGGAFLQPTLALLKQKKLLKPAGLRRGTSPSSPTTASRRSWTRSAPGRSTPPSPSPPTSTPSTRCTTPRPALDGQDVQARARPTTTRTIVKIENGLEDQLPAPLVTKDNVDDTKLWANQLEKKKLAAWRRHDRTAAVHAEGIVKRFGPTVALDGARLTVRPGEAHALVGRNGAGKSTLVSVLTGMARPDAGRVAFGGEPAPGCGRHRGLAAQVACVYQKSMIVPELTVAENLFLEPLPGRAARIRWRALRERRPRAARRSTASTSTRPPGPRTSASSSGSSWRSPARCPSAPGSSSSTSPPPSSTPAASTGSSPSCATLQRQGVAFLFISHHLQEVYEICDTVTVFRDARHVLTAPGRRPGQGRRWSRR